MCGLGEWGGVGGLVNFFLQRIHFFLGGDGGVSFYKSTRNPNLTKIFFFFLGGGGGGGGGSVWA